MPDQAWSVISADKDGVFHHQALRGGYAYACVELAQQKVMILEAAGHSMVYVNGEPRGGDVYNLGYTKLPVLLKKGKNDLLFACGRGSLHVKLSDPPASACLNVADTTLPDIVAGKSVKTMGAVIVMNCTPHILTGITLRSVLAESRSVSTVVPSIPPYAVRKVPFHIAGSYPAKADKCALSLSLVNKSQQVINQASIDISIKQPGRVYKETFISKIDGSLQYYAVVPRADGDHRQPPALVLSLHGATVEANGMAGCYQNKSWGYIVSPTNRRPYGFDWEGIGALDALEVLDIAQRKFHTDPQRTYLTGHSMGGHGTWHIGATWPDRFAALAPSSGWVSLFSYAGSRRNETTPAQDLLTRAMNPSDTLELGRSNYTLHGIYAQHGSDDDNVPVTEMRSMLKFLLTFHKDFNGNEVAGAGHWYDGCVDVAAMFEMFARHRIPNDAETRHIQFTTANPAVSGKCHWVTIEQQMHQLMFSRVDLQCDPGGSRISGTTENVTRMVLSVAHLKQGAPVHIELNGQKLADIPYPASKQLHLALSNGHWVNTTPAPAFNKNTLRGGPFKRVLNNRVVFVYGTKGTDEQNRWALAKARYDAENLWYRGNGAVDVLPDTKFRENSDRDRNVILYGNADTNSAWKALLPNCPIDVRNDVVHIGDKAVKGTDVACMFVYPRAGSDIALVGAISGTGVVGMRINDRIPYLNSGVEIPDFLVVGSESLLNDHADPRAVGYFGSDWRIDSGEFVLSH